MTDERLDVQKYARIAGLMLLVSMLAGGFGEAFAPGRIMVASDAAATARNIQEHALLFRAGFAAYLVEACCDIALSMLFYVLLRPVSRSVSLLAAFFGLVSTATFAVTELFYLAPLLVLKEAPYLSAFSVAQRETLALLSMRLYAFGSGVFFAFYGVATFLRGALMLRARYFPRWAGMLLLIAGSGFVIKNLLLVLAPSYASDLFVAPVFIAILGLTALLLTRGVDVRRWAEQVAAES